MDLLDAVEQAEEVAYPFGSHVMVPAQWWNAIICAAHKDRDRIEDALMAQERQYDRLFAESAGYELVVR